MGKILSNDSAAFLTGLKAGRRGAGKPTHCPAADLGDRVSPLDKLPAYGIIMWPLSTAPQGWAHCDGKSYTVNGTTFTTTTIAHGRFVCEADIAAGSGGADEVLSTGGYKLHGGTGDGASNNHSAHYLYHEHEPVAGTASGSDNSTNTGGPDWGPTGGGDPVSDDDDLAKHSETDNRPPYIALFFIQKLPWNFTPTPDA